MKLNFWLFMLVAVILLCQGTWIFIDARKRGEIAWLWGLLGLLNFPTSLLVYLLVTRRREWFGKKKL